jgi:hypothetical protein
MTPLPARRLPVHLEAAAQRLKQAVRAAVDRTVESLGLSALSAPNLVRRDDLLAAQFELNRKATVFAQAFNEAFDEWIAREAVSPLEHAHQPKATNWDALSLVEDQEVEKKITAERFAQDVMTGCEWELRELDGYVGSLLGQVGETAVRNPLRPEVIGHAVIRGVAAVSERPEVRKVLQPEIARSIGSDLRATYADIVSRLRAAGVQPLSLAVRQRNQRAPGAGHTGAGELDTAGGALGLPDTGHSTQPGALGHSVYGAPAPRGGYGALGYHTGMGGGHGAPVRTGSGSSGLPHTRGGPAGAGGHSSGGYTSSGSGYAAYGGPLSGSGGGSAGGPRSGYGSVGSGYAGQGEGGGFARSTRGGATLGTVDATMMALMRRLAVSTAPAFGGPAGGFDTSPQGLAPNVIRAHRHELRAAATGALDHLVIDVIGSLFDAILADPKVPPQLARQIARLQLPVLRAALGDPSFFASRRHPVRRFINRIASLGTAFDELSASEARAFLAKVRDLVQAIVEGDFEQIDLYESKLAALEEFASELSGRAAAAHGAAPELLAAKEDEAQLTELYSRQLGADLRGLTAPDFVVHFVTQVWSRVLLRTALQHGGDSEPMKRARQTALDLVMSVQAKPSPQHRKTFLAQLPNMMQALSQGLNLIAWPEGERRAFFGQLMPAHAEALKAPIARVLDTNLMAKQVDVALAKPVPARSDLGAPGMKLPVLSEEIVLPKLTPAEAQQIGLLDEASVNWNGKVDIDVATLAEQQQSKREAAIVACPIGPLPAPGEPAEPTAGRELAEHVQVGTAYRMHLDGEWQGVRLVHVSPARTFYVFTRGERHKRAHTLTHRMLVRLCESGRLRAVEGLDLLDRATARARQKLSQFSPLAA